MRTNNTVLFRTKEMGVRSAEIYEYQKNHPEEDLYSIYDLLDSKYSQKMEELAKNEPFNGYLNRFYNYTFKAYRFGNDYSLLDKDMRVILGNHPEWSDCFEEVDEADLCGN